MQLLEASRDELLRPLTTVAGIVERRTTTPILGNILIRKQGSEVAFIGSDKDVQITTQAAYGTGSEDFSTTVAARKLLDILRALPETHSVRFDCQDDKLTVLSGKSRFALQTLPAHDYPESKVPDVWQVSFSLPQKTLRSLLHSVHFAMAQQDIRFFLNGMLLKTEPGIIRAVATDGHRLAHNSMVAEGVETACEAIIPRKTVLEMLRLLGEFDDEVHIDIAEDRIRFRFAHTELISKLVEGKFPDFNRVIPTSHSHHFTVNREQLQASLQRAAILTAEKLKGVLMNVANNVITITASNTEQEQAREEIELDYAQDAFEGAFNVVFLLDLLGNIKDEAVRWSVQPGANSSVLISLPEDDSFKYVVMPMRL